MYFEHADKYFIPFLTPTQKGKFSSRELNDILPEHNEGMYAVPQILTNKAEDFIFTAKRLQEYGYREVNLNLGCPSKTVVSKHRGSGFLTETEELTRFLDEIFEELDMKISIKTRIGRFDQGEFEEILGIYNRYPLEELIIHPRIQMDFYKNHPRLEVFEEAVLGSRNRLCYNGDLFTVEDYAAWKRRFPQVESVMMGRGVLINPGLIGRMQGGPMPSKEVIRQFHDKLYRDFREVSAGDKNVLFKMKETWVYLGDLFTNSASYMKKIKKAEKLWKYEEAVDALFEEQDIEEMQGTWITE